MTPIKYHQLIRIEKAKEMIRYSRTPLKEIACLFGYENIHSFSRTFRQVEGVSPSYYRPRHQADRI
ncbi:helix-turn-helix domain-containing protein [Paenibacillus mendelii]|uniref:Helix-turn-helix domain-containing protein n=1 Tax=Paenibacillus mendelii TaxID=206163 RepID=A0ABV6JEG3_9BACL|nr:helix-turn-helix domain-containing protein [Paenibacillus mendelii]MCQ6557165.1 helix-turn-helix domain-containing protein [Paenibacillus mendelii]